MKTGRAGRRDPAAAVVALLLCCPFLSTSFFESQASAATTGGQQPEPAASVAAAASGSRQTYFGTLVGKLASPGGQVSGDVYAVDEQTLFIRDFHYDGQAPDAYFWSSTSAARPSGQDGFIVPDEKGSTKPLERYAGKDVVLRLPEGKTLREIPWLSIWSRQLKLSVGDIMIPRRELLIPRPLEVAPLSSLAHGLRSGPVTIVDAQTLLVSEFHYDGLGPDAYFWLTRGGAGLAAANSLKLKDENGLSAPLRKYQGETIVISLPDEFTVYDFDFFGVWCKQFGVNFGQTQLPAAGQHQHRVPPSPKMLGIKPENKLNCEILYDDLGFEIRWVLDGDDIVMQLVGKIEPGEYMAFGLGKDDSKSDMNNADAVVAWVERPSGQVHAADYFLGSKQQCVNDPKAGSCPDVKLANGSDSLTLLHGAIVNGYSMVTFKRPQLGVDELYDQHVYSDGQQSVIWAIGALNKRQEIGYHRLRTRANMFIDFARNPQWNCPIPDLNASMHNNLPITSASQVDPTVVSSGAPAAPEAEAGDLGAASNRQQQQPQAGPPAAHPGGDAPPTSAGRDQTAGAWFIPQVVCPADRTFYAQIGPTAGRKGYAAQTGRTSWVPPVGWYINGLLVPELVVERGQTYRFVVEGGNDKASASRRHPLYLTDSPEGGFNFKTDSERLRERIFAGVAMRAADGQFVPTAEGRLCEWKPTNATLASPDLYPSFSSYQRTLKLDCLAGQGALLKFAPDAGTPDVIYYQCYTNRFMGWRIRVVDSCGAYISSQLNQLKQQQQQQLAAAGGNQRNSAADTLRSALAGPAKDSLARRESISDAMDLKPQASESYMSTFELPPPGFELAGRHAQMRRQFPLMSEPQEFAFLQPGAPAAGEFGDEFSPSEAIQQSMVGQALGASSPGAVLLNNSYLWPAAPRFNLTTVEQILKLSPSDLEFLDDSQLDMVSAVALASASNPSQLLSNLQQPVPAALGGLAKQAGQNATASSAAGAKGLAVRMPKSLYSYMRRLAAIYQPVQQQLASMLSLQSAGPGTTQAPPAQTPASQQQQQQMIANLHQQIIAASAIVPTSQASQAEAGKPAGAGGQSADPTAAASSQSSSFSLASLVPKSKIDLSKSNLGKRFNKLRMKTGRKYEPPASAPASQAPKQQSQPPTPDNEFNYDIFNNQLLQLEERQKQYQSIENFAAALAAANSNNMNWQMAPGALQQQPHLQQSYQLGVQQFSAPAGPDVGDNFIFPPAFESHPLQQQQQHQQHFVEPLQQQQSTLNVLENMDQPRPMEPQQQQAPSSQQQAVFITKLQQQPVGPIQPPPAPVFAKPAASNQWQQEQTSVRYPQAMQQAHQPPRLPGYLDSTDYNSIRQNSPASTQKQPAEGPPPSENSELLNGSDGTNHYLIRQQEPSEPAGDSDHMLAIERYSKQSSERRAPSVVLPVTGEQVYAFDPSAAPNRTAQHQRFSSKLIDKHIVEPGSEDEPNSRQPQVVEMLDTEQSAQAADLRRLNASESEAASRFASPASAEPIQSTTTELPAVLLKPVSALDFFASDPPATTTMAYVTRAPSVPFVGSTTESAVAPTKPAAPHYEQQKPTQGPPSDKSDLVLKTNLIEPIKSTLVPTSSPALQYFSAPLQQPSFSPDTSPFTPIEFASGLFQRPPQVAPHPSNLLAFRLRPPPLVESMLSQYRSPYKPEPPVQVASFLARQLAAASGQSQSGAALGGPGKTSQQTDSSNSAEAGANQTDHGQRAGDAGPGKLQGGLIILKPALPAGRPAAQTYALRPEYLTTSGDQRDQSAFRPIEGRKQFDELQQSSAAAAGELLYGLASSLNEVAPLPGRRLAGHQFDRLSSLSSPPSTSMVLDPMQVSNSVQTYNFQLSDQLHKQQPRQSLGGGQSELAKSRDATPPGQRFGSAPSVQQVGAQRAAGSAQSTDLETGPAAGNRTDPATKPADPSTTTPAPFEFNILQRDNNTDNAILSHVMSLISSNAVPTPPLVPLASAFSSADYFIPVGERTNSHHHNHHYHHQHHHQHRRHTLRTGRSLKRLR